MRNLRRLLLLPPALCLACQPAGPPSDELLRATNRGKAHLENRQARQALEAFSAAVEIDASALTLRNLARAHLLARDERAALNALERAATHEPQSAAASYLTGLAWSRQSLFEEARPHFEAAVRLDAHTAALRFQLASTYKALGSTTQAAEQLLKTVELDPLHTGAHYQLAALARRAGDRELLATRQREFERLRRLLGDENRSPEALEKCLYTEAESMARPRGPSLPMVELRFVDRTEQLSSSAEDRGALAEALVATVLEVDAVGAVRLFVAGNTSASLITFHEEEGFKRRAVEFEPFLADLQHAVAGNFHDDVLHDDIPAGAHFDAAVHAQNDILLLGTGDARLLRGKGSGEFEDLTEEAGLGALGGRRALWLDYENDGDLDLAVAGDGGLKLWQNNGDGRFEEVSTAVGIHHEGPAWDLAAVDLDDNLAVDLVVAGREAPTEVFENRRTGMFQARSDPPGPWPAARRVLANDLDGDSRTDVVLLAERTVHIIYGGSARRAQLDLGDLLPSSALLIDPDNDGALDLLVAGSDGGAPDRGRLVLWRNGGSGAWTDVTDSTGLQALDLAPVRDVLAVDLDNDGDSDLIALTSDGLRWIQNEGGNARPQLKLRLVGTKSNPNGLGARLEVRRGSFWHSRTVTEVPVEIGLGADGPLDSLRILWPNGIVDNRVDVPITDEPLTVVEKNVAAGSCPFLYAWNGEGFRFVTDILGNAPVGLSLRRGVPLDADPDELVRLGDSADLVPRDGAFVLRISEEMREVLYLDSVRLLAVDHAPAVEVHSTDKLRPAPFPKSELVPLGALKAPREVLSDDGLDRRAALEVLDGVFAPPGTPLPPPFRGMTRPLSLILDFGPLETSRPLTLALTGWLQYGDASTNIALSQGPEARVIPPRLEARTADGRWHPLDVVVGMPAGKTKTILVDLDGRLPPGARLLRLTTSFEIRWDRIVLAERLPRGTLHPRSLPASAAHLFWRGFSDLRSRAPGHPTTPDFDTVLEHPPWRTALEGWATRYGEVLDLVRERDERLAILSAGDAVELRFDAAALPPVPVGQSRTFFLYSVGWDKDGDVNVIDGESIEPLPVTAVGDDWQVRYNTRWVPRRRFARR